MSTTTKAQIRKAFKHLNRWMILMWRLGLGSWLNAWPQVLGQYLVLTHTGRKTGIARKTPINYAQVDGKVYCVAGFGKDSDWFRNIQANPHVEVWLPDGWWEAAVEDISNAENRLLLIREVLIGSGFAAVVAGVNPRRLTDNEIDELTRPYRVLHIQLDRPRTGPGGPNDLGWVWPLAVMVLLPIVLFQKRRNS